MNVVLTVRAQALLHSLRRGPAPSGELDKDAVRELVRKGLAEKVCQGDRWLVRLFEAPKA